jgi:hypothetical protein
MLTVISHYNEDIAWLEKLPCDYIVYSKTKADNKTVLQDKNIGNEASSYLEYIVKNYDNLHEWTYFFHGHLTSPHQEYSALDLINKIDILKIKNKWLNFGNYYNVLLPEKTIAAGAFPGESNNRPYKAIKAFWHTLGSELFGPLPGSISSYAAAQFIVHRDLIHRHDSTTYSKLLNWLYTDGLMLDSHLGVAPSFYSSRLFEWIWYYIFTGNETEPKVKLEDFFL